MTRQSWESARDYGGGTCTAVQLGNYKRRLGMAAYVRHLHGTSMVAYVTKWHGTSTGSYFVDMSFEEEGYWRPRGLHGSSLCDF